MKKKNNRTAVLLIILSSVIWVPILMIFTNSFMGIDELMEKAGAVFAGKEGMAVPVLFPSYPTLAPYVELLLDSPEFFVMFWNSCLQVFPILAGQMFVAVPAAWALGTYQFKGKKLLLWFYMILMILPFQVTMVSSYLVLKNLDILDTHLAIILPGIFGTFPVFIMTKSFAAIPRSCIEAAKIDGAGEIRIFTMIGIPMALPGIVSALVLSFLECWNMIEQPMTFLKTASKWPLSLYLPNISADNFSVSFAASVAMMMPAVFLFLWGFSYLEQGIAASGLKE